MKTNVYLKKIMKQILLTLALICAALAAHAQSWTNRYGGSESVFGGGVAIALDTNDNVIVTGVAGDTNALTIKYSNSGIPLWTNSYSGLIGEAAFPRASVADTNGNVVVTGDVGVPGAPAITYSDFVTIKYSSAGVALWTNRYKGPVGDLNIPSAMALDSAGNVLVTGSSPGQFTIYDWATVKYSSAGVSLWTRRFQGPRGYSAPYAMTVDGTGNAIITGFADEFIPELGGNVPEMVTIKYSGTGVALWTNRYLNGAGGSCVAVGGSGDVFVSGSDEAYVHSGWTNGSEVVTIKYSSSGVPLWTNYFGGPGNGNDRPLKIVAESSGGIAVYGATQSGSNYDLWSMQYSGVGTSLSTNHSGRFVANEDGWPPPNLAVDANANMFVAGTSGIGRLGSGSNDWATVKYSTAGVALWTNRYDGLANGDDVVRAVATDSGGNAFAAGKSWNGTSFEYLIIKYAAEVAAPYLNIQRLGSSVVLSWPNTAFSVQSAPSVTGTFTNVPGATSPYTNPMSAGQAFFRLSLSGGCSSGISGLLAHEPFDYPAGSALDTMNGGAGFSGPWSSTIAGPNYIIADGSLNFSPLCVSGGRLTSATGHTQMARTLASDFGADGSTRYFSFLLRPEGVLNGGDFGGFHGLVLQGVPRLFIGKTGGGALESYVLEEQGGAGQVPSSVTAVVGETVLLVVKAEFAVGNDTFTLYVNPAPGSPEPATGTVKSDIDLGTSNTLFIYSGGEFSLDELRFGETFESVTPR